MKRLIFILALFFALPAFAGEVTLRWDANPEPDVMGYRVYQSDDLGQTWQRVADTNSTSATLTVPDDKMILFKVSAYDGTYETVRNESGVWYNGSWNPPAKPKEVGVR